MTENEKKDQGQEKAKEKSPKLEATKQNKTHRGASRKPNDLAPIPGNDFAEMKEVLVSVNRTTKVVKGGRRFSFAAVVVVGDGQGRVGYGLGKAKEILEARTAKKSMIKVPLKDGRTVFHDIVGRFGSGHVILRSAKVGTGVIAGGPMRPVFEMLGINDIVAKSMGSSNVHNIVGATFDALRNLRSPEYVRNKRAAE
jgi:small subunit ribosomal protein S5